MSEIMRKKNPQIPKIFCAGHLLLGMMPALKKSFVYPVRLWKKKQLIMHLGVVVNERQLLT